MDEYLLAWEEAGGRLLTYKSNSKKPSKQKMNFIVRVNEHIE